MGIQVKICGVTNRRDALVAADLGATHIGLNFWSGSPRCLEAAQARAIADAVRGRSAVVGVFVNADREVVNQVDEIVGLDALQFHGDEPAGYLAAFGVKAWKVVRVDSSLESDDLRPFAGVGAFLFEARHKGFGGSGTPWQYGDVAPAACSAGKPTFVAGGIHPENACRALQESRCCGVDICSGVETRPGDKDERALQRLFAELERCRTREVPGTCARPTARGAR